MTSIVRQSRSVCNNGLMGVFDDSLELLAGFAEPDKLTVRIAELEFGLERAQVEDVSRRLQKDGIDDLLLRAALDVKRVAGQINVIVHAVGILVSLPYLLEPGEVIHSLSLGAGNTGRCHDLETDRRVAEFKFIDWKGGPESIRQNSLFVDLFNLASAVTEKRRVLYVVGKEKPLRFLTNRRALTSVLSKNAAVEARFRDLHGTEFSVVRDYYMSVRDLVDIVDVRDFVPAFREKSIHQAPDGLQAYDELI